MGCRRREKGLVRGGFVRFWRAGREVRLSDGVRSALRSSARVLWIRCGEKTAANICSKNSFPGRFGSSPPSCATSIMAPARDSLRQPLVTARSPWDPSQGRPRNSPIVCPFRHRRRSPRSCSLLGAFVAPSALPSQLALTCACHIRSASPFSSNLTSSIPIGPPLVRSSISMPAPPPPRPQKSPRPRVSRSDRHLSRHDSWPTTTSIRYRSPDSDPPAFRRSDFSAFYVNLSLPSKIRAPVLIHENIPDLDSGPLPPYLVRSLHESGNPPMLSCAASWLSNLDTAPPIIPSPLPRDCCLLRTVQSPS